MLYFKVRQLYMWNFVGFWRCVSLVNVNFLYEKPNFHRQRLALVVKFRTSAFGLYDKIFIHEPHFWFTNLIFGSRTSIFVSRTSIFGSWTSSLVHLWTFHKSNLKLSFKCFKQSCHPFYSLLYTYASVNLDFSVLFQAFFNRKELAFSLWKKRCC